MDPRLERVLERFRRSGGKITFLAGAGISAESGIPTFRGEEGYYRMGSEVYHPEEMATRRMFGMYPYEVWKWYLYRKTVCNRARPNPGHLALVRLEEHFGDRFRLITQNVDGLHIRAGNTPERTYMIHGSIDRMRCWGECASETFPVPQEIPPKEKDSPLEESEKALLVCPRCGSLGRPHVLWFDECYDEEYFRIDSSLRTARSTDLLVVVGTSGATTLPIRVGRVALERGAAIVDVNPDDSPFSQMAASSPHGCCCREKSASVLPEIAEFLIGK